MPTIRAAVLFSRTCLIAACLLLMLCPVGAAARQARNGMPRAERHAIRHQIDRLEQEWVNAIVHRNVPLLDSLLSDDYTAITSNGTLQSKQQTLDSLREGSLHFSSIELSDRKVRFYGHTALVTSKAEVNGTSPDGDITGNYRYTRVYVRDSHGNWRIVSFEASRIREPGEGR